MRRDAKLWRASDGLRTIAPDRRRLPATIGRASNAAFLFCLSSGGRSPGHTEGRFAQRAQCFISLSPSRQIIVLIAPCAY